MFDNLSSKIESAFKHLKGNALITELNVSSVIKDIRKALLEADVNYKIAKDFTDTVKNRAIGEKVIGSLRPDQVMIKIMQDELTKLLGEHTKSLNFQGNPAVFLVVGLQGSGKTTFSAKLATYLKNNNKNAFLIAGDVYRPAAIEQLKVLGKQIDVDVYAEENQMDVNTIVKNGLAIAKQNNKQIVIIDTAGRQSIDDKMMAEVKSLKTQFNPQEILFVIDAMTGQDAVNTAKNFNDALDFTGVVISKLDGDTKGGAALSVKYVTGKPIQFISNGEKMHQLELFHPDRLAQRILGMGDIASMVEKVETHFSEEKAKKLASKMRNSTFNFNDFKEQIEAINKMGNIKDLLGMVPGMGKQIKSMDISNEHFTRITVIINSMTPQERENPSIIDGSRRKRIAKGCGKKIEEVNSFMNQFEQMSKMMKNFSKGGGQGFNIPGMPKFF